MMVQLVSGHCSYVHVCIPLFPCLFTQHSTSCSLLWQVFVRYLSYTALLKMLRLIRLVLCTHHVAHLIRLYCLLLHCTHPSPT